MSKHFGGMNSNIRKADRTRSLMLLSLAFLLLFSCVGVLLVYSSNEEVTKQVTVEKEPQIDMVDVLVPVQLIDSGSPLEPGMFRLESRPKVGLSAKTVKGFEEIQGFYARSQIMPEQPLHSDFITKVKPNNSVTTQIPEGYRAVTIQVDARSSVEGWARPGAKVDVVWSTVIRGEAAVNTIVQNAKVLSAERRTDSDPMKDGVNITPSTVTLLVTAQDAAKIQLATTSGTLSLNLRGDSDIKHAETSTNLTISDLISNGKQIEAKKTNCAKVKRVDGKYDEICLK